LLAKINLTSIVILAVRITISCDSRFFPAQFLITSLISLELLKLYF
jgi:hypothetical protein